ncbi:MAG: cation transporter [Gammaproteobacteria bacterium]|nr:cation transporter [Gammaproteobacteria bacterium]MYG12091.1 cation transporter [Gammaproteobacteria bacterium]MYH16765.1 cation transporter [Gammaproteobacteria bacterium]MYK81689.1 cation transporter [Gammaproteobacteria bacterium]
MNRAEDRDGETGRSFPSSPDGGERRNQAVLGRAFLLIASFAVVEIIGGILSNSLTLLADAGHMVLDAAALGLAWGALWLSRRPATASLTYGHHRVQVMAAFLNGLALALLVLWILKEAFERFVEPQAMAPVPALIVATIGLIVNLIAYRWLDHGQDNINVQAAALHVLGDLLGSLAAITAALTVHFTGWTRVDPLLALVIAAILIRGTWRVLKASGHLLLQGAPNTVSTNDLRTALAATPGVIDVHDLHVWGLTAERPVATLHVRIADGADRQSVTAALKTALRERFGVAHSTIQLERGECPDGGSCMRGADPSRSPS